MTAGIVFDCRNGFLVHIRPSLEFCSAYVQDAADVSKDIGKLGLEPEVLPPRARSHLNSGLSLSLSVSLSLSLSHTHTHTCSFSHYYVSQKDACNQVFHCII